MSKQYEAMKDYFTYIGDLALINVVTGQSLKKMQEGLQSLRTVKMNQFTRKERRSIIKNSLLTLQ